MAGRAFESGMHDTNARLPILNPTNARRRAHGRAHTTWPDLRALAHHAIATTSSSRERQSRDTGRTHTRSRTATDGPRDPTPDENPTASANKKRRRAERKGKPGKAYPRAGPNATVNAERTKAIYRIVFFAGDLFALRRELTSTSRDQSAREERKDARRATSGTTSTCHPQWHLVPLSMGRTVRG
jgi:hypothetical protein